MLYHYNKFIACTTVLLCITVCSYAQEEMYHGGYHDGFAKGVQINFSPSALAAQSAYKGGNGDGYAMMAANGFSPGTLSHYVAYTSSISDDGYGAAEDHDYDRQFLTQYTPYTSSMENDGYAGQLVIGQVLPIQLLSFTGMAVNKTGHLIWTVANENDIVRYELERSKNSIDFETIFSTPVTAPATTETQKEYIDQKPFTGKNFYRLKIYGYDGEIKYSIIVLLVFKPDKASITVYPNPAKDFITVTSSGKIQTVELFDMSGKRIRSFTPASNDNYSLAGVKAGMYILSVQADDKVTSVKVLVQ